MNYDIQLQIPLSETQAERLQKRLSTAGMKVAYQEEQHGAMLIAKIGCTPAQERTLREILDDMGVSANEDSDQ